ncbi:MAG: hypothetical protein ACMXYE_01900 [Candidatus Woesearchaeota archaeon]
MKIKAFILTFFVVTVMMGSIRFLDDNDFAQNSITVHANIDNRANTLMDETGSIRTAQDVRMRWLLLDEPYLRGGSAQRSISGDSVGTRIANVDIDNHNLPPGEYMVRIYTYGNDGAGNNIRRIKHRPIIIQ